MKRVFVPFCALHSGWCGSRTSFWEELHLEPLLPGRDEVDDHIKTADGDSLDRDQVDDESHPTARMASESDISTDSRESSPLFGLSDEVLGWDSVIPFGDNVFGVAASGTEFDLPIHDDSVDEDDEKTPNDVLENADRKLQVSTGKTVSRKRGRESGSPVASSSAGSGRPPSPGLSDRDKRICLEEMIATPRIEPIELTRRVHARGSTVSLTDIRRYRKYALRHTLVPGMLHDLLMNATATNAGDNKRPEEIIEVAATKFATANSFKQGTARDLASNWLRYCIEPFRARRHESINEVFYIRPTRYDRAVVHLCDGPVRALLKAELDALDGIPSTKKSIARVARAIKPRATAVPVATPHRRRIGPTMGLSDDEKRACLQMLIDNPTLTRQEFIEGMTIVRPGLPNVTLKSYFSNLALRARVPKFLHHYLLSRKATRFTESMITDLTRLWPGGLPSSSFHGSLPSNIRWWIQYCITPLIARPSDAASLCTADPQGTDGGMEMMRLSPCQRQAMFRDILAAMT